MATDGSSTIGRDRFALIALWGARLVWIALAVFGGAGIGSALASHDRAVQLTGTIGAWIAWGVVALALLIPSTLGLTVVRAVVPAALVAAAIAALEGDDAIERLVCVGLALLAAALVASGELGQLFAQSSAYGDERRFVLRPPVAYLLPTVVSWCVLCAAAIAGPLLVASGAWAAGAPVSVAAVVLAWFLGRRYHRLARRWVVVVPAGIVIHDHLVLAETAMFPRTSLAHVALALEGTEAADLTGPAAGMAVEIALRDTPTVVLAATRNAPRGTALHVRSVLVAPTRPGRMLAEVARRGFPVG